MDIIHLLPDTVANQIAAGEVIQRPASCLKELVENSLDAGATHIQVIVRDAGRTMLQVVDDGSGMSATDVRMAFERHATSKIRYAEDLFSLRTMGFRGEALASICAVAQVEVLTRRSDDEMGTLLEIAGGEVLRQEPCQCAVGTNIKVKNLFFNVPVRRKFLKTDQTELRNILTEFYHIVLVYPKVQFTLVSNDEIILELPVGSEKQRIETIFGRGGSKTYTSNLVDVKNDTELVSIRGFVGKPETATKNAQQYFFVNGRFMRHPYFHKAILSAFSGMLTSDYSPSYFIYFDIEPQSIDVNIHPTKTEIKFQDEQTIFQILLATVREALGKFNLTPSLDFNREGEIEMPTGKIGGAETPKVIFDPNYNPFRPTSSRARTPNNMVWEQLYQSPFINHNDMADDPEQIALFEQDLSELTPYCYRAKYILLPYQQGLLIIDQHRAHIRVLYEQYMQQLSIHKGASQQLLFPEIIDLDQQQMMWLNTIMDDLRYVGFELEQFSKNSFNIVGIPALLQHENAASALSSIIQTIQDDGNSAQQHWQEKIALSLARETAIPYGKKINEDEAKHLLQQLFATAHYRITPDGKTIVSEWKETEINKRF